MQYITHKMFSQIFTALGKSLPYSCCKKLQLDYGSDGTQQFCVCRGWGVSGMNVVIKAFLSREPLEQHQSKGHGKRSFAHPTSWQHFPYTSHKQLMFTRWNKKRGAYQMKGARGVNAYIHTDCKLCTLFEFLF